MSHSSDATDSPLEHEPVDEDRPSDPDETELPPLPEDERPLDPADLADPAVPDEERRVRLEPVDDDDAL